MTDRPEATEEQGHVWHTEGNSSVDLTALRDGILDILSEHTRELASGIVGGTADELVTLFTKYGGANDRAA